MSVQTPRIAIVGGGIAGLSAAWRLQQMARSTGQQLDITLLEATDRAGGKLVTERHDGLIFEGGPDSLLSQKPAAIQLCEELGIADRIIGTSQDGGGTFILRDGRLQPLPEGITLMVPTNIRSLMRTGLISWRGKLRMGLDYFIKPKSDDEDESVESFVTRRLGREAYERMAQPLLSGIYAGDAGRLSILSTFPRLRETERKHGGLIKGMLAMRKARQQAASSESPRFTPFVSLAGGMGEIIETLDAALEDVELRMSTPVERIQRCDDGSYLLRLPDGETLNADAVLVATPAYATASLVEPVDGTLAALLRRIEYVSSATVSLVYRRSDIEGMQRGRGFVIPRVEGSALTAVTWASNKFPGRVPEDKAMLRTFVGRAGRQDEVDLPDDELLSLVQHELSSILGITADPVDSRIFRWHRAMPQYELGHRERVAQVKTQVANQPGLFLLGAAYAGVGIPDCIESGRTAAQDAATYLDLPSIQSS